MTTEPVDSINFTTEIHRVIGMVREAVQQIITVLARPDRQGGYFCLIVKEKGNPTALPTLILGIGTVPTEKGSKYFVFAQEKAHRLSEHPEHQTSWQSRNPEENKWGGAINAGPYYLSFSGLPEPADEAAMLLAAVGLGFMTRDEALTIAEYSNNVLFAGTLIRLNWGKAVVVD